MTQSRPDPTPSLPTPRWASPGHPTQISNARQRFPFPIQDDNELTVGFVSRLIVATTLPLSPPADNEVVRTYGLHDLSLLAPRGIGLPSGRYPRLVLAWMITEAIKMRSPHLLLGPSFSSFAVRIGITPTTGPTGSLVHLRDQIHRLVNLNVSAISRPADNLRHGLPPAFSGGGFRLASQYLLWWGDPPPAPARPSFIRLSRDFFDAILAYPIPIDLDVLRSFRSPLEMDIYTWLTYRSRRSCRIQQPETVSWEAIERQFGADYSDLRVFRNDFLRAVRSVRRVYPEVPLTDSRLGLVFHPLPPRIPQPPDKP